MGVETQVTSTESETATPGGVYIPAEGRPGLGAGDLGLYSHSSAPFFHS